MRSGSALSSLLRSGKAGEHLAQIVKSRQGIVTFCGWWDCAAHQPDKAYERVVKGLHFGERQGDRGSFQLVRYDWFEPVADGLQEFDPGSALLGRFDGATEKGEVAFDGGVHNGEIVERD